MLLLTSVSHCCAVPFSCLSQQILLWRLGKSVSREVSRYGGNELCIIYCSTCYIIIAVLVVQCVPELLVTSGNLFHQLLKSIIAISVVVPTSHSGSHVHCITGGDQVPVLHGANSRAGGGVLQRSHAAEFAAAREHCALPWCGNHAARHISGTAQCVL